MRRKLSSLLAVLLLLPVLMLNVSALNAAGLPLVVDEADLLTAEEEASLETTAQSLGEAYAMDIVILTVNSLGGQRPQDYADDYFDYQGYGVGDDRSGALLLLSMEERDWYISTSGDGIYALTDYGIQQSMDGVLSYLGDGEYYDGFSVWLSNLSLYFEALEAGAPIDGQADYSGDYYHGDQEEIVYYDDEEVTPSILLSLMVALPIAAIAVLVMRLSMNTKRAQSGAGSYLKSGSFQLRNHQDIFLYSRVTKTRKAETSTKSSGGGSSVHTSSSGRSHGGGGGKF